MFLRKNKLVTKRKMSSSTNSIFQSKLLWIILVFLCLTFLIFKYRNAILYYFSFKSDKVLRSEMTYKLRNEEVLFANASKVVGIDVSHYQGKINWSKVEFVNEKYPIEFVFIRATQGFDKKDNQFNKNWNECRRNNIIRGAYHYYRPNENSLEQAENFIKTVKLSKGDLPPVLDIEKLPQEQSIENLKIGLKRFLDKIEEHYEVRPIIYTGERYYNDFLKDEFEDYTFWIANYNFIDAEVNSDYLIWQFTEQAKIKGIREKVDVNIFNGSYEDLRDLRIN